MSDGALEGRIAVITGAGRGIGRHYALLFAAEGAKVVVNDLGCEADGTGADPAVAQAVVDEITAAGGTAVANGDDVAEMAGAESVLAQTLDAFGGVDVVVNNAGILRDKMFASMSEDDWDSVIRGHLKSTFCMTRVCAGWWRDQTKAAEAVNASVINISSTSGLIGQVGQSNYGAAKSAIAGMTVIIAQELGRYGVRVNCVTPAGRTRMTEGAPGVAEMVAKPAEGFDVYHPFHPAPVVGWLATADCEATGRVFMVKGGDVRWYTPWLRQDFLDTEREWTIADLAEAMKDLPPVPVSP
ncbi:SDR family oxidoreductase [Candidatus Poriferisocius sp.]|uniref:SDR family oxidoreductase n=1 Tax=Candidatus Poriferisocius sp. TaxID=3101276 RepID=UPI003B0155C1